MMQNELPVGLVESGLGELVSEISSILLFYPYTRRIYGLDEEMSEGFFGLFDPETFFDAKDSVRGILAWYPKGVTAHGSMEAILLGCVNPHPDGLLFQRGLSNEDLNELLSVNDL